MKKAQVKELAKFAMTICVWIALAVTVSLCSSGCMTNKNTINAYEGSTVTQSIDQKKTVTTTTDASIPPSALGL